MNRFIFLFLVSIVFSNGAVPQARAQDIHERCAEQTHDSASYFTCVAHLAEAESSNLQGIMCAPDACFVRLDCTSRGEEKICAGSGFTLTVTSAEYGSDIVVQDPEERVSYYSKCGTCRATDYESGPLGPVETIFFQDSVIIEFAPPND